MNIKNDDKIQDAVKNANKELSKVRGIFAVILYGSVARGDYSTRHSDIDLLILIENNEAKKKSEQIILKINTRHRVNIHPEYQTYNTTQDDQTLLCKMFEEGKVLFSKGIWFMNKKHLGLNAFRLYIFDTTNINKVKRVTLSRALHGRKKKEEGIIDNTIIIESGKGGLLVRKDKSKDIESMFKRIGVKYKVKMTLYG